MENKKLMQIALDALEEAYHPNIDVAVVMEALRAALEQTDMQIGLTYEEANSPVAWVWNVDSGAGYLSKGIGFEQTNIPFAKHTPLYTAPSQREWVGLTPADRVACEQSAKGNYVALWAAIEAKLKEKNSD